MGDRVLVYLVTTDSSDTYVFVFRSEPTKEVFAKVLSDELGEEAEYVSSVVEYWENVHS